MQLRFAGEVGKDRGCMTGPFKGPLHTAGDTRGNHPWVGDQQNLGLATCHAVDVFAKPVNAIAAEGDAWAGFGREARKSHGLVSAMRGRHDIYSETAVRQKNHARL